MSNVNKNVHLYNMNRLALDLPRLTGAADAVGAALFCPVEGFVKEVLISSDLATTAVTSVAANLLVNGVKQTTVTITENDGTDKQQVASLPNNFKLNKNDRLEIEYVETGAQLVVITLTCRVIIGTLNG